MNSRVSFIIGNQPPQTQLCSKPNDHELNHHDVVDKKDKHHINENAPDADEDCHQYINNDSWNDDKSKVDVTKVFQTLIKLKIKKTLTKSQKSPISFAL